MTKLSDAQRELLTALAHDEGGTASPASDPKTIAALIRKGFVISLPLAEGASRLLITGAGREAAGENIDTPAPPEPPLAAAAPAADEPRAQPKGKVGGLVALLRTPGGATIEAMMAATGWQAHSVRGAMAGAIKKKLGLTVVSEKADGVRVYRIPAEAGA